MEIHFPIELQRQVEQAIVAGEFPKGQLLGAKDVAARFRASLDDVRTVLQSEHRKGLIVRETSDEYCVLGLRAPQVESVFQHTTQSGLKPSSQVRGIVVEPADSDIAARLELPVGAPVYRLERTRLVNGEILANQTNVIPFEVCAGLENDDVSHKSFQQLIDGQYRAVTTELQEEFAVLRATRQDLEILGLSPGAETLAIRRLALSATSSPLIWTDIHIRPDRFAYVAALWPSAKEMLKQYLAKR